MGAPDPSALSEQQLGMALLRSFERGHPGSYMEFGRVLHHWTRTRKEIDFVDPAFGGIAIESKYVDGRWRRPLATRRADPGCLRLAWHRRDPLGAEPGGRQRHGDNGVHAGLDDRWMMFDARPWDACLRYDPGCFAAARITKCKGMHNGPTETR